jgi:two-component system cell cycle sensor histidine kinase/response regulator CckA
MKVPARLLIIEDDDSDIGILLRLLERSGLEVDTVVTDELPRILGLLDTREFDAILTDHQLGAFTASEVLSAVAERHLDIPVLVVSGAVGEDRAATLMREGAADFIRKDNLSRLIPALSRELRESQARRSLREATDSRARSESLLRLVVELSGDSFWEWDLENDGVTWSDTFLTLCGDGARPAPHIDAWRERLHPEDRDQAVTGIDLAIRSGDGHWSGTFRFLRGDGTWALLMARCFVVRDQGRPVRVIGAMADITERQSLVERQRVFTALVDQAAESIAVVDPESGRFLEFNAAAYLSLGYTPDEFASRTLFDIDGQHGPEEMVRLLERLRGAEARDLPSRHRCKDGRFLLVRIHSRPIRIQGRHYLAMTWQDVTERTAIERELRQAQKMEILGQIAGGVSHDFNNILAVMRLQIDVAQMKMPDPPEYQALMETLSGMVDRATNLTRHLLQLNRKEKFQRELLPLDDALDDLVEVSRRILGARIEIRRIRSGAKPVISADRSIMEQVFMNLFVNARDAMPDGGTLTIETRWAGNARPAEGVPPSTTRHCAEVRVSDTGLGMSKETLAHIEEPFFTTKEPGKGTGLGLSTARRCLRDHGGWMTVESEPGLGTTFSVFLPLAETADAETEPDGSGSPQQPARVLLHVRDAQLRMLARKTLERLGCCVHACANPQETLRVAETVAEGFALMIVPMNTPIDDNGEELARRVRSMLPSVPMILTRSPGTPPPRLEGNFRILETPFAITEFIDLVETLLRRQPHPVR